MKYFKYILFFIFALIAFDLNKKRNRKYFIVKQIDQFNNYLHYLHSQGVDIETLRRVEQIYRLETAHFTSVTFSNTYGAGALAIGKYPYGFDILKKVNSNGKYCNKKNKYCYIKFKSIKDGINFLILYLNKGGIDSRTQKWGSAPNYLKNVKSVKPKFI